MDEKPKSIWKKSWTGWRSLLLWFILFFVIFLIGLAVITTNLPFAWLYAIGLALVGVLLVAFIHWLRSWRNFKRFLFGVACLATLIALFYAEEDWRGKHDWGKFKRAWEAKGEKFDFADFVPPPVPDDQNFAMAPIFDATDKLANRKWRSEHRNQHGSGWDTNLIDRLQIEVGGNNYNDWPTNGGNWQLAKMADLKEWQNYYRTLAAKTNEFPIASQPQSPAQDILLALGKYDLTVEELRQASQLPYSRFPLDYDDEDPAEILLPHLAALKRCSQILRLRALAELENGENEKAFADVKLALHLADSVRTEPFIITHLVRIAILELVLQPVWEGLAEHKWSDTQLAALDLELAKLDFLADYEFSIRSEPAAHVKVIDYLEQKRSRAVELFNMLDIEEQKNTMSSFWGTKAFYLAPKGWFYQNELVLAQMHQKWNVPMVDDANQTVSPKIILEGSAAESNMRPAIFNFFARLMLPTLGTFAQKTAYSQNAVNLALTAVALERYRLANGNYPDSLDALAPQFVGKIPHDIINGEPLHYRRTDDGQFVLYSVGWNETDDGGVVVFKNGSAPRDEWKAGIDMNEGDWVWRYPAKSK
jgi:hypothetical protein